jgi:hypothetical protein
VSLYQVDKIMREINLGADALEAFSADRAAYLEDRDLSAAERKALIKVDSAALYAMGGHPLLLLNFVQRTTPGDRGSALRAHIEAIQPLGVPDFAT